MKIFILILSLSFPALALADSVAKNRCGKISSNKLSPPPPLTIQEIEKKELDLYPERLKIRSDYPKKPFGFANGEWVAFKSLYRPGDKIVEYTTDTKSWKDKSGEMGYYLIRNGCIIESYVTSRN